MKYIDSHAHYLSGRFAKDRDILLNNLLKNDLEYIIECGTNTKSNQQVIELCKKYKNIYGVIGYFPMDVQELENAQVREKFIEQLKNDKVLAIGEIGLDYYHKGDKELQKKWFKEQLKIAKSLNLPVCIHSRDAEEDTLLYQSGLVEPGMYIQQMEMTQPLAPGEYEAFVDIQPYKSDKAIKTNSGTVKITLTVG